MDNRAELEEMGFEFDSRRTAYGWEKVTSALLTYKSLHGDLLVPQVFVIPKSREWPEDLWNMKLGIVVSNIRSHGQYSTNRAELEEMGFKFDSRRTAYGWEKVTSALLTYKSLYADLLVPQVFVIPKTRDWPEDLWDMKLGIIVSNIRNNSQYSAYRSQLEEMGFKFDSQRTASSWETMKRALLAYKSLHGNLLVPKRFVIPKGREWPEDLWEIKLGCVVSNIRNNGQYSTYRSELEEMGFNFDSQRAAYGWETVKHALLTYKSLHGDLLVPQVFVIPKTRDWPEDLWDMKLGIIVSNIRSHGQYSTNRAELEEMGFKFDSRRTAYGWEKVTSALLTYKSLHGDLLVPQVFVIPKTRDWPEDLWDMKLGRVVSNIRNNGQYSTNRAELEEMGFKFDSRRTAYGWEKVTSALLTYKSLHGDLLVPQVFVIPKSREWPEDLWNMKLGIVVSNIRSHGQYSTNRAELEEMGFKFDSRRTAYGWEKVTSALLTYKSLYADLLVPQVFVIPKSRDWPEDLWDMKLGIIVSNIRNNSQYSAYRSQLEEMGFKFDSQRTA